VVAGQRLLQGDGLGSVPEAHVGKGCLVLTMRAVEQHRRRCSRPDLKRRDIEGSAQGVVESALMFGWAGTVITEGHLGRHYQGRRGGGDRHR